MKHLKPGIFLSLLLLGFLLVSCDAIIKTDNAQKINATPEEIHSTLTQEDYRNSAEMAKAFALEQKTQENTKTNISSNAYNDLKSQDKESEMMHAANTEFQAKASK